MSAWKSRWSWVRLVNSATSKWIASARCSDSACEETSIAQARSPASSIRRKVACRSIASGVVRSTSSSTPPTTCFTVPSSPHGDPRRLEDLPDQERRGRLPVGPGDPHHPQLRRRVALEPRRQRRHRRPRVRDHHLRHRQAPAPARRPAPPPRPRPRRRRSHARRPSPRARRRTASRARPCGCHRQGRRPRPQPSPDDPRALASSREQARPASSGADSRNRRVGCPTPPGYSGGTPR